MQRLKIGRQLRGYAASAKDMKLDPETRMITFPFSSELPVERWFGNEILSHANGACDLSRFSDGAQMLFNHGMNQYIGVIEKSWIGDDKRGWVTVRFSKAGLGDQIMKDVEDGIIRNVSFGYIIREMDLTTKRDDGPSDYTATDWEPYEVSFVTVPADPTVGVGRSIDDGIEIADTLVRNLEQKIETPAPTADSKGARKMETQTVEQVDKQAVALEAAKAERERAAAISALGDKYGKRDLAQKLIADGADLGSARGAFLEALGAKAVPVAQDNGVLDLSEKEKRSYSVIRALNASVSGDWSKAGFERECSLEIAKRAGKETQGFFLPTNINMGGQRSAYNATGGTANQGANIVATNLMAGDFIELLRNKMVVLQLGAKMLSGLVGNVAIPKQTAQTVAYWVTEGSAVTEDESMTFGLVTLSPKTIGARSQITRQMLLQSTPDIEMLVRNDLATVLALGIDKACINGSGSSGQPTGILNQSGIGSVVGGTNGANVSINNFIDLETAVAVANADVANLAYLTNPKVIGSTKKLVSTTGQFLWTQDPVGGRSATPGSINGYPVARTNQVPSNLTKGTSSGVCSAIIFGNWSDLLIGEWGVLEILPNPYGAGFTAGSLDIRALQSLDIQVRHAESFAAMTDALTP
jgi:HK97 family phage major capsid protein/HK97 family phage prohead protease